MAVQPIRSGVVIPSREPVAEVVDLFRDLLERAERGEVRAVAVAASGELEQPVRISGRAGELSEQGHTLIGQLFVLQQDLAGQYRK